MKEDITVYRGKHLKLVFKGDRTVWLYTRELGPSWVGFTLNPGTTFNFLMSYSTGIYGSSVISFAAERHYQKNGANYYETGSMTLEVDECFDKYIGFKSVKLSFGDSSLFVYISTIDWIYKKLREYKLVNPD